MSAPGWDLEWAATKASESMRYLTAYYPERSGSPKLHAHQDAAHQSAVSGDCEKYLEALRSYIRAGRDEALRFEGRRRERELNTRTQVFVSQRAGPTRPGERGVSVLFALIVSLCAAVAAALFVTMWLDGDAAATAALAFALLPLLVLTMMAWGEAL